MVALRIFQLKHKEAGVFIHYLPRSTAKSCFSGHLCFGISSSQQQSLGCVPALACTPIPPWPQGYLQHGTVEAWGGGHCGREEGA